MNDFNATPVNWDEFCEKFEALGVSERLQAAMADGDSDQAAAEAQEFLNSWLWTEDNGKFPETLGFFRLGELAAYYPVLRPSLDEAEKGRLDALYGPFAAQWMEPAIPAESTKDLPPGMKLLAFGGLSVALNPERVRRIAGSFAADSSNGWQESLSKGREEGKETVAEVTEQLLRIVQAAADQGKGVISVFEI
jgi:hypothetical protein